MLLLVNGRRQVFKGKGLNPGDLGEDIRETDNYVDGESKAPVTNIDIETQTEETEEAEKK